MDVNRLLNSLQNSSLLICVVNSEISAIVL